MMVAEVFMECLNEQTYNHINELFGILLVRTHTYVATIGNIILQDTSE